jgi:hypothetical protein
MPPKSHLAADLIDNEFLEVERRQQGKRKTIAESANPIIERGPKKGKAPTATSKAAKGSSDVKPDLGKKEQGQPKRMDQDPSDGHSVDDTAQDWQTSWWDDDAGDFTAREATEPKPSYKPGLFERDPNAKTSDGKVRSHVFCELRFMANKPRRPTIIWMPGAKLAYQPISTQCWKERGRAKGANFAIAFKQSIGASIAWVVPESA